MKNKFRDAALDRAQFDLIILDEPTSSVDVETERRLIENLRTRPATQQQVRDFARRILDSQATQDYLASLWQHLRAQLEDSSGVHSASLRATVAAKLQAAARLYD